MALQPGGIHVCSHCGTVMTWTGTAFVCPNGKCGKG